MRRRGVALPGFTFAAGVFSFACGIGGGGGVPEPPRHLVLVTVDTLRADRVGAYGGVDVETPSLDRIASEGAMARSAAHVPLTRPSHASLFTGMLPTLHGVRDNISPATLPDVPTIPSVLESAGFRTGGFISSVVLASGGFERDFGVYSREFGRGVDGENALFLSSLQRPGDETVEEALAWMEANRDGRLFTWVHLYEPHEPYEPPERYRSRYADRLYDGEVAYADELVGRLDDGLSRLGMKDETLLVVTSDHGEGMGDHGENLHGFFVYESTLQVPLLIRGPGIAPGTRLEPLVRTIDLFPTITDLLGLELPEGTELSGKSVAGALRGADADVDEDEDEGGDRPAYGESLVPLVHFGWSDLRSLRRGDWKYIEAPRPELYDLGNDPAELTNLAASEPGRVEELRALLEVTLEAERNAARRLAEAGAASTEPLSQELRDQLAALGYVGAGAPMAASSPDAPRADPKDKIDAFREASALIREGIVLFHEGDYEGSVARYRELLAIPVDGFEVHLHLARSLMELERYGAAEPHFEEVVRRIPEHAAAWEGLARCRSARGDLASALAALDEAQRASPDDALLRQRRGALLVQLGRMDEARKAYAEAVALAPEDALLRARFGELLRALGDVEGSVREIGEAVALEPQNGAYENALAMSLVGAGRLAEAESAFRRASELEPENARYAFNVGLVLMRQERPSEAKSFFERALDLDPRFEEARRYLHDIDRQ